MQSQIFLKFINFKFSCDRCKNGFWSLNIDDPDGCKACNCHLLGTFNNEGCNKYTGECLCKRLVAGESCDQCLVCFFPVVGIFLPNEFFKILKDLVYFFESIVFLIAIDFHLFQPEHYGLNEEADGCKPCDCDIGGSFDNNCDAITGQCKCRANFNGRRCDKPNNSYFCANIDYYTYEAESANITNVR